MTAAPSPRTARSTSDDVLDNDVDRSASATTRRPRRSRSPRSPRRAHGTVVIESGKIRYTPTDPNYNGSDSFTYTVTDNGTTNGVNDFKSDTATVTITITEVNDAPIADDDSGTVAEDSAAAPRRRARRRLAGSAGAD